jgi:hypothetical protein
MTPDPDYKSAWEALSKPLSWMHDNTRLKAYWGWNLADIANDLVDRAYPGLRLGEATALSQPHPTVAETVTVALPAPAEVERLRQALRNIAEGNLGDAPWQANYARIKEVAAEALATVAAANDEAFARWIEAAAKVAENFPLAEDHPDAGVLGCRDMEIAAAIRLLSQGGEK